jgi:FdhE protein
MPYIALDRASRPSRLAEAASRWEALLSRQPDLEPAVALQRQLIGLVIDLAEAVEHGGVPKLSLPARYLAAKLSRGVPALAGEPIPVPSAVLKPTLLRLCEELSRGGAGAAADHIQSLVEEGRLEPGFLFAASLARDQQSIRSGAAQHGLAADLLWLVAELAVSPFAHVLQRQLFTAGEVSPGAQLPAWGHGYCPACGSWPALAEVAASHRTLRCSFCALAWELDVYSCIYCGEIGKPFVTAAPNEERKDRRLEVCSACSGYLKTVDVAELSPFPLLAIADLETMDLDMAAMERGYARPALKEFLTRR